VTIQVSITIKDGSQFALADANIVYLLNAIAALGGPAFPASSTSGGLLSLTDAGLRVRMASDSTIPANVFRGGDAITYDNVSGGIRTITQGSGLTLTIAGTATTGNRTLAVNGICTVIFDSPTSAKISGPGLS
jgi:hypothetical protein